MSDWIKLHIVPGVGDRGNTPLYVRANQIDSIIKADRSSIIILRNGKMFTVTEKPKKIRSLLFDADDMVVFE